MEEMPAKKSFAPTAALNMVVAYQAFANATRATLV
jgi:hypothetical protein